MKDSLIGLAEINMAAEGNELRRYLSCILFLFLLNHGNRQIGFTKMTGTVTEFRSCLTVC